MKRLLRLIIPGSVFLVLLYSSTSTNILLAQGKQPADKNSNPPAIANIKNQNVHDGCGCYFSFPSERKKRFGKYLFISDLPDKHAWMNIDGRDIKLSLTHSFTPKVEKIGSRLTRTYVANGITVSIVYVTRRMCAPNDDNCESTDYDATFTVLRAGRKRIVKFWGGCGC